MKRSFLTVLILIITISVHYLPAADKADVMAAQFKIQRAFQILLTSYADDLDPAELSNAAIKGMTEELDPYTLQLRNQQKFRMDVLTKGEYGGVGIQIGMRRDTLTVISPMEDSPAWKAGVMPGDLIMRIDSTWTNGGNIDELAEKIRGRAGTKVDLLIWRGLKQEEILYTLTRSTIEVHEIPFSGFIEDGTGYIKLNGFSKHAAEQFRTIADSLYRQGMERLVLDLRNNTGGLLDQAVNVLNVYLPKGEKVVYTRGLARGSNRDWYLMNDPVLPDNVRIAVLVNHGSASASEIVAGATQDLNRGIIVGQTSFGKGLVQNIFQLDDSSSLKLTTSKYFIPSGRLIQKEDYFEDSGILSDNSEMKVNFTTRSGREVPENGGIVPDSTVENPDNSPIVIDLWRKFLFSEFAGNFMRRHPDIDIEMNEDYIYSSFLDHLSANDYSFENPLIRKVADLEDDFRTYYSEEEFASMSTIFNEIQSSITTNTDAQLTGHRDEILPFIKAELYGYRGGQKARISGTIRDDLIVSRAVELLKNDNYLRRMRITPFYE